MINLLDKSKQVPRLSKTKKLQNPYQSTISTNGQPSRIFLLNDRQKVTLSEQSDDEPQITIKKNIVAGPRMRFPTFQPNKITIDEVSEFGKEFSSKQFIGENYTQKDDSLQMGNYKQYSKRGNPDSIDPIKTVSININPKLNTMTTIIKPSENDNILIHSPVVNKKQPNISTPQFTVNKPTIPSQKYQQKPQIHKRIPIIIQHQQNMNKKQHLSTYPSQQKYTHKQNNSLNNRQQNINNDINKQLKQIRQLIREQVGDNNNVHRFSIYLSESRSEHQQQSLHIQQYNQQQIAQQQCTQYIFKKSQQIQHINSKISVRNSQKLQLYKASRIVQLGQSNTNGNTNVIKHNRKGSIIDKIKQSGFIQSRIIDQHIQIKQYTNNQDNNKNKYNINNNNQYNIKKQYRDHNQYSKNLDNKNQYKNRQNKNSIYNNDRFNNNKMQQINKITQLKPQKQIITTNKKKRIKIFEISSNNKPMIFNQIYKPISSQKQQSIKYIDPSNKTPQIKISQLYQHHAINTKYQPSSNNIQRYRQRYQNTGCPHTQCLIKSLEIIDKLTQPNHKKQLTSQHKNMMQQQCKIENSNLSVRKNRLQLQIENQSLQISMQVDKILAQLMLPDLLQQQTTIKIKRIKIQIQTLLCKIKKYQQQNQQFTKQSRFTSLSTYKKPINTSHLSYRVQLSEQLQQICKILHYIQIVQQRYKMWKTRLYHLSQRIKNIFKVDKISQIKKLSDITQHISEIQGSKFYGNQVLEIGLVQGYNRFVDKQVQELKLTLQSAREWLRNKSQQL